MTSTLIFGGSGKVARQITRLLHADGQTVHSLIRRASQAPEIEALGGRPIVQSIEDSDTDTLAATMRSCEARTVLWCAGAGGGDPSRTRAVDQDGAIRSMDAAAAASKVSGGGPVERYILVSAVDVRARETKPAPEWYDDADRERSDGMWKALGPYMEAKLAADRSLVTGNAARKLAYTIVRPGRLTDEPGTGAVAAGRVHLSNGIPRADVAAVVVECMRNEGTVGLAFDCVGGDTPVTEAVAQVAKDKVDTFAGRY